MSGSIAPASTNPASTNPASAGAGSANAASGGAAASGAGARLAADIGTFLTLLTTQLRNQDPTNPMDTETLTQQLVQFATVEQQLATNDTLGQLLALQQAGQLAGTAPLVGRRVTMESEALPLQDGQAELLLPAAGRARQAVVELRDQAGTLLRQATVPLGAEPARWVWDGRDAGGLRRPDGAYRVEVKGLAEDGTAVPLAAVVSGRVTGATRVDGEVMLRLGAATIGFDRLRELPGG